jgi:hypothetical protein
MTTKVSILEKKIEVLLEEKQKISSQRYACRERFEKALTRGFSKYFRGTVSEDIRIECTQTGIYFKKMNEEGSYEKELFSIYLRENYFSKEKREEMFRGCELSYYTTSTNSDFELERLENLGRVATFVRKDKQGILDKANELAKIYDAELAMEKFYERESEVEKQIRVFRDEISTLKREESKKALFSEEGLSFEKGISVRMKFNYEPRVSKIKLIDVSKSGKKATAVFTFAHGIHTSREENVDVEKIVSQVI